MEMRKDKPGFWSQGELVDTMLDFQVIAHHFNPTVGGVSGFIRRKMDDIGNRDIVNARHDYANLRKESAEMIRMIRKINRIARHAMRGKIASVKSQRSSSKPLPLP